MSDVMMKALQIQVESLTRQVETLGPENERVRKLLTEFDQRHDADQARIRELEAALAVLREARGVRVKPLVWRNGGFDHDADLIDETETYQIQEGTFWYGAQIHGTSCADNETAKAAAQADYERRILAALEPAPVTPAETARVLLVQPDKVLSPVFAAMRSKQDKGVEMMLMAALDTLADTGEAGDV